MQEPRKLDISISATALSNVGRNRSTGTTDLACNAIQLFFRKRQGRLVDCQGQLMRSLPHLQLPVVLHDTSLSRPRLTANSQQLIAYPLGNPSTRSPMILR